MKATKFVRIGGSYRLVTERTIKKTFFVGIKKYFLFLIVQNVTMKKTFFVRIGGSY
jgi:hypothetical protein